MTTTTPTTAGVLANIARQARTGRAVLLTAEDAMALLDYLDELETDRNGWRSVAGVRQERIVGQGASKRGTNVWQKQGKHSPD